MRWPSTCGPRTPRPSCSRKSTTRPLTQPSGGDPLGPVLSKDIVDELFTPVERQDEQVAFIVMCPNAYAELRRIGRAVDLDIETKPTMIQQGIVAYLYGATVLLAHGNSYGVTVVGVRPIYDGTTEVSREIRTVMYRPWLGCGPEPHNEPSPKA